MAPIAVLVVALIVLQPSPSAVPRPSNETVLRLLKQVPEVADGGKRNRMVVGRMLELAAPNAGAFWVEVNWDENGKTATGVALVANESVTLANLPVRAPRPFARHDGWLLMGMIPNKTLADHLTEMAEDGRRAARSKALGDIRTMISAQVVYQMETQYAGYAPTIACLEQPSDCIVGYAGPTILSARGADRRGADTLDYQMTLHPGPAATVKKGVRAPVSRYAYSAVPPSSEAGLPAFCGDDKGVICQIASGKMPPIVGGTCPASCVPIP